MPERCPTCGQPPKRTAVEARANRRAKESDYETGACKACRAPIIVGWTGGVLNLLDHRPLSPIGEAAAVALGLHTFVRHGARFRDRGAIERRAGFPQRPNTVHIRHECGRDWDTTLFLPLAGHENSQSNKPTTAYSDKPPF